MAGYHFYQRVDRHREVLEEKRAELDEAIKKAINGIAKRARIHIHPTHFHVFAGLQEKDKALMASRIREEISKFDVKWDSKHYLIPIASLSDEYVSKLLRDMHREPLI